MEEIAPEVLAVIIATVASTINTRSIYKIATIKRADYDLSPNWIRLGREELTTNA